MATIAYELIPGPPVTVLRVLWEALTETNTDGSAFTSADFADRSVQVIGTFGGTTVTIEGSNDGGTTWTTLSDAQGTALSFTSAGMETVGTLAHQIRPFITGGTGVNIDVYLLARSNKR